MEQMNNCVKVCTRCTQCVLPHAIPLVPCQTCAQQTALCKRCNTTCRCTIATCIECFVNSHTNTCHSKRHPSSKWNPMLLWTCSCHRLPRHTNFQQQMRWDLCNKAKLCLDGAVDCDCGCNTLICLQLALHRASSCGTHRVVTHSRKTRSSAHGTSCATSPICYNSKEACSEE